MNCGVKLGEELDGGKALWPGLLDGAVALPPGQGRGHVSGHVGHAALSVHSDQASAAAPLRPGRVPGEHHPDTELRSSEQLGKLITKIACEICWALASENCPLWLRYWSSSPVTPIFLSLSNEGFSEETCNKITQDADVVASPEFNRN